MTLRSAITGTFDRANIKNLGFPIAWSGTVGQADRAAQEAELSELLDEAYSLFDDPYRSVKHIQIQDGQIVDVIEVEDDEWEA